MKKKIIFILIILIIIISISFFVFNFAEEEIIPPELIFSEELEFTVYDEVYLKDLILNTDIELNDKVIDTSEIGSLEVNFNYNYEEHNFTDTLTINIIDDVAPTIFASSSYTVVKGSTRNFLNTILCGDNYDDEPIRKIIGEYDLNTIGTYNVTYFVEDSSGNSTTQDFKINVIEKTNSSSSTSTNRLSFQDVIDNYKTENTRIGIDVSKWQGKIDFEKVKEAGCEFVIIRLGYQNGFGGEMVEDPYFEQNIENALEIGLDVGVYIYTYASTKSDAINQALWVIDKVKDYDLSLGVSYDWESWTYFNQLSLSYYHFTELADIFLDIIKLNGYNGMLYSSKYYLENIWLPLNHDVWLAHYTSNTTYSGSYRLWQMSSVGKINGIDTAVDIDILYE